MKQRLKMGDEWDVLYARKIYCYLQRAGAASEVKIRLRRRSRHDARRDLREGRWD